jgi:hypothetical protein
MTKIEATMRLLRRVETLTHTVECRSASTCWGIIAAFYCESIAKNYATECKRDKSALGLQYRVRVL